MRKLLLLVALVLALGAQTASAASSLTVSIKKNGFSPSSSTLDFGARVTWRNADTTNHQVVANDGSFASPVIAPGKSWSFSFVHSGTFRYHDALHPSLTATLKVNGPPPSLTLALDKPIVDFGTQVMLSGKAANIVPGTDVTLYAEEWSQPSPVQIAVVRTGDDGSFGYLVNPRLYTTYTASFQTVTGTVQSNAVYVQVAPRVTLTPGKKGWMHAQVNAGKPLAGRHLFLQRRSAYGQWVNVAPLKLGRTSGILFRPASYLATAGPSRIRVSLSVNQAGIGLLGNHSGTQQITLKS